MTVIRLFLFSAFAIISLANLNLIADDQSPTEDTRLSPDEYVERFKLGEYRELKTKGLARIVKIDSEKRIELQLVSPEGEIEVMSAYELRANSVPTKNKAKRGKTPKVLRRFSLKQIPRFLAGETAYFNGEMIEVLTVHDYNRFEILQLERPDDSKLWVNLDQLSKAPDNAKPNNAGDWDGKRAVRDFVIGCRIGVRNDSGF